MEIIPVLLKEQAAEAETTRKMLSRVPADKFDWRPHPKSMSLRQLAGHIAELGAWPHIAMNTDELDFAASPYSPPEFLSVEALLQLFETSLANGRTALEEATEERLNQRWKLRNGDQVYLDITKYEMVRTCFCQIVHHRAQLGVFLRLLDIPIPGSYGPSADEADFS